MTDTNSNGEDARAPSEAKRALVNDKEVCCFGMILGLHFTPSEDDIAHETPIPLVSSGESGTLINSSTNSKFGILGQNSKKIVAVLQQELTLQLFADQISPRADEASKNVNGKLKRLKVWPPLELCIVLYGSNALSQPVSMFAARCHLYLQQPRHCNLNVPYRNPQCLSPEYGCTAMTFDLTDFASNADPKVEISANPIDLFADATIQNSLMDAETPSAIKTELYKHQKQALTFMVQRERGWAMAGHLKDIWKEEYKSLGRLSYHNVISGLKQSTPPRSFRGGLLIDAPGLGKSLSILALILSDIEGHDRGVTKDSRGSPTLVIVPKTLIQLWKDELHKHLRSSECLKYCVYYGKDRLKHLEELEKYALVITTYSVVRLDWKTWLAEPPNPSTLHAIQWKRIVLDEAHIIREPSKSFAKSVCALQADKRWAVTGTPIQNRLMDLYSLFKYLRCYPFDDLRVFNAQVTQNWKSRSDPECIAKLKTLVNCLSLRRPKTTIQLLPRKDNINYLDFDAQEWQDYQRAKSQTLMTMDDVETCSHESRGASFLNALKWVNELRLICNHGTRVSPRISEIEYSAPAWNSKEAQARFDQLEAVGLAKCSGSTCGQDLSSVLSSESGTEHEDEPWITESLEIWCCLCLTDHLRKTSKAFKICNHLPRRYQKLVEVEKNSNESMKTGPTASLNQATKDQAIRLPTKVRELMSDLVDTPDDVKSVVFSSWTKTLDIIQPQLWDRSIRCVRLDGSLSASGRTSVLRVFRTNPGIKVLLATISCGGVGLDLTAASRAYIMEPQWNPMSESQALDRIYRLGQTKEVRTIRYIMKGSWEEQVLKLQRRKQELAELTLNSGGISKADLTFGRLQYLKDLVG